MMRVAPQRLHRGTATDKILLKIQFSDQEVLQLIQQGRIPQLAFRQGGDPPVTLFDSQLADKEVLVSVPTAALEMLAYGPFDLIATVNGRQLHAGMSFYQDLLWLKYSVTEFNPPSKPMDLIYWLSPERGSMGRGTLFHRAKTDLSSRWFIARCSLAVDVSKKTISNGMCDLAPSLYGTEPSLDCDFATTSNAFFSRCIQLKSANDAFLSRITRTPQMPDQTLVFPETPQIPSPLMWNNSQLIADSTGDLVILQDADCLRYFAPTSSTSTAAFMPSCLPITLQDSALAVGDLDETAGTEIVILSTLRDGITATILSRNNSSSFELDTVLSAGLTQRLRSWLANNPGSALASPRLRLALNDFNRDGLPDLMIVGTQKQALYLLLVSYIGKNDFEITEQKMENFFSATEVIKSVASGTIDQHKNIDLVINSIDNTNTPYVRVLLGNGK